MSRLFFSLILLTSLAEATVDGHTRAFVVVKDIQTDEFLIERVPVIGCYGLSQGPQLEQFTAEYRVPSNIGCGGGTYMENINYLVCAKVKQSAFNDEGTALKELTLDISECPGKNDPKLQAVIRTAARLNFPQEKGVVRLTLITK